MHSVAAYASEEDDARFFGSLMELTGYPLYEEDNNGDQAAFLIARVKSDGVFEEAFKALVKANFDL